jgi:hypothetical protein
LVDEKLKAIKNLKCLSISLMVHFMKYYQSKVRKEDVVFRGKQVTGNGQRASNLIYEV